MAEVVVVGAGLAGLATAGRLAKLGHHVTVCERTGAPGGLLCQRTLDGFTWDATPFQTTMPAVLRDLFRKSGRPIERYVDLTPSSPARRHVFSDGTLLDLPAGSRAAQLAAVSGALGPAAGAAWTGFVDAQAATWEQLRPDILERPDGVNRLADRQRRRALYPRHTLHPRRTLESLLHKTFRDQRLRFVAGYPAARTDRRVDIEPAFAAVESYLERTFGVWRLPGGAADLTRALLTRMGERSVDVRLHSEVTALRTGNDRVVGVELADGTTLPADLVVTAVPPDQVFDRLLSHPVARSGAALFAAGVDSAINRTGAGANASTHLGLAEPVPDLADETVLHGDPMIVVSRAGSAPDGHQAWTVETYGRYNRHRDLLAVLASRGLDVRAAVVTRLDPPSLPEAAYPLQWRSPRTAAARAALAQPLPGLYCLGTSLVLGASVPFVAWQGAHVAELVGKA